MSEELLQYSAGQRQFLKWADSHDVDTNLFGAQIPEIDSPKDINPNKPTIILINTGGTIACTRSSIGRTLGGSLDIDRIFHVCPEIRNQCNLLGIHLTDAFSENFNLDQYSRLAATVKTVHDLGHIDGIMISHGTDMMDNTAPGLAFALRNPALPIVFVSSMNPLEQEGTDAIDALKGAVNIAVSNLAEVLVYSNHSIYLPTRIEKVDGESISCFVAPGVSGPAASLKNGILDINYHGLRTKNSLSRPSILSPFFVNGVQALPFGATSDAAYIRQASNHLNGLVLQGTASGGLSSEIANMFLELQNIGFPILFSSRNRRGLTDEYLKRYDFIRSFAEQGVIHSGRMTLTVATVKLSHVLANMPDELQGEERWSYISKEIAKEYAHEHTLY